jgi:hypothetical protein
MSRAESFAKSVMFFVGWPLFPLATEAWVLGGLPSPKTATLTAALYVVSTGAMSDTRALFYPSLMLGFVCVYAFAHLTGSGTPLPGSLYGSLGVCALAGITHLAERIRRHLVQCEPC